MIPTVLLPYSDSALFNVIIALKAFIMKTNSRKCYIRVLLGETKIKWQLQ